MYQHATVLNGRQFSSYMYYMRLGLQYLWFEARKESTLNAALIFSTLSADSAGIFSYFPIKTGFDISCKLSQLETS